MITLKVRYESQRIAYWYLAVGLILFGLQIVIGLLLGAKYVWDNDPLRYFLPFSTARALHVNLLVIWLLLGFMGATYYLIPEETGSEIYSPFLARLQLGLMAAITLAAAVGYLVGWSWGMPFLEQPLPIKLAIVVAALIFLFNVFMTAFRRKKWTVIQAMLVGGLVMLALMFLAGIFFMKNITTQYFYWWWVIHLWVEGAWELVAGAITAFILLKLTGVERSVVEKWLYIEAGLVLFTGIAGTGHHYYWIGTPGYYHPHPAAATGPRGGRYGEDPRGAAQPDGSGGPVADGRLHAAPRPVAGHRRDRPGVLQPDPGPGLHDHPGLHAAVVYLLLDIRLGLHRRGGPVHLGLFLPGSRAAGLRAGGVATCPPSSKACRGRYPIFSWLCPGTRPRWSGGWSCSPRCFFRWLRSSGRSAPR
jgi:hypothetical protein